MQEAPDAATEIVSRQVLQLHAAGWHELACQLGDLHPALFVSAPSDLRMRHGPLAAEAVHTGRASDAAANGPQEHQEMPPEAGLPHAATPPAGACAPQLTAAASKAINRWESYTCCAA